MEFRSYINVLIKRLWIILLIPLLAALVTAYINLNVFEPVFESSITFFVLNKDTDSINRLAYDDILASQQLINDCRELIKSKSMTKAVIKQLNLEDITQKELAKKITVNLKNDTRILEIKVKDTNNERAKAIVEEISIVFQERVRVLINLEISGVIDEAEVPYKPVSPRPLVNTFIVFCASMFLVISFVFIIEYLDDKVKNAEDVENLLGLKVIGIIPSLDLE